MTGLRATAIASALVCVGCSGEPVPLPPVPSPAEVERRVRDQELATMVANVEKAYRDAIRPLAGDDPVQCNGDRARPRSTRDWEASPQQLAAWFTCVQEARAAGRTSVIALEHAVDDGRYVTGVLGSRDGVLRAFTYSQSCCGGPKAHLEAGPCEAPTAQGRHPGRYGVHCRNEDARGRVPTPELWSREGGLPPDLSARLLTLASDGAIDCGFELNETSPYFRPAARVVSALACTRSATASGRGFWILVPSGRFKSPIVHGLVGQASGTVSEFLYDTAPCRGPDCPRPFDLRDCERPRVVPEKDGGADFRCGSRPTVRGRPSPLRPAP